MLKFIMSMLFLSVNLFASDPDSISMKHKCVGVKIKGDSNDLNKISDDKLKLILKETSNNTEEQLKEHYKNVMDLLKEGKSVRSKFSTAFVVIDSRNKNYDETSYSEESLNNEDESKINFSFSPIKVNTKKVKKHYHSYDDVNEQNLFDSLRCYSEIKNEGNKFSIILSLNHNAYIYSFKSVFEERYKDIEGFSIELVLEKNAMKVECEDKQKLEDLLKEIKDLSNPS